MSVTGALLARSGARRSGCLVARHGTARDRTAEAVSQIYEFANLRKHGRWGRQGHIWQNVVLRSHLWQKGHAILLKRLF